MQEESSRNWRQIAKELTHTIDSKKVIALSEELDRAIQEQGLASKSEGPIKTARPPKTS